MGARGPARKPKKGTIKIPHGVPKAPAWLDFEAQEEYARVVQLLDQANADIRQVDMAYIAAYAQGYSDVLTKTQELREEGDTIFTAKGHPTANPKVYALTAAHRRMTQAASRLGFSPLDRLRLPAERPEGDGPEDDPFAKFSRE